MRSDILEIISNDLINLDKNIINYIRPNSSFLITGASGLIGIYFVGFLKNLNKKYYLNLEIDVIINNPIESYHSSIFNTGVNVISHDLSKSSLNIEKKYDFIFYAAGYAQPSKFLEDPLKTISINTSGLLNTLEKLKQDGSIIYLSTSEIYNGSNNYPFSELSIGRTLPSDLRACYIESKRCGEAIINSLPSSINKKIARVSLAYGPGTKMNDQRVMNSFIQKALKENKINLMDTGNAFRAYCYISTTIEMLLNIFFTGKDTLYNVGGKSYLTIRELAIKVSKHLNVPLNIPENSHNNIGAPEKVLLDISKYENEFGTIKNEIEFDEGLKKVILWYQENINQ